MRSRQFLILRFSIAITVLCGVLVFYGWRGAWFYSMPVAVVCSLGRQVSRQVQVLFVLGWVAYLGGVAWIVADYYRHPLHPVRRPLRPIVGPN